MKKFFVFSISFIILLLCYGCGDKSNEISVNSQAHNNVFTYVIDNTMLETEAYKKKFEVKLTKEEFFAKLETEDNFIEIYNDNIVLFLSEKQNNSSYFAFIYNGESVNKYRYDCKAIEKTYISNSKYLIIDFPFFVLDNTNDLMEGVYNINCSFDYILDFYERINYVIDTRGEDFIVLKSYYYGEVQNEKIRIKQRPDNKIFISNV